MQQVEEMCTRWEEFCGRQVGKGHLDLSSDKRKEEVRQLLWKGLPMANKCRRSRVRLWERYKPHVACGMWHVACGGTLLKEAFCVCIEPPVVYCSPHQVALSL